MNQINNNKNSFFFFVDFMDELESKYLKIDNFFQDPSFLFPNKFFSIFSNEKIDFDFLEKNEKLISFFFIFNKIFFKNHIKNLKLCFTNENMFKNLKKKMNISFFLNFYFFFRHVLCFIFVLKKICVYKKK